MQDYKICRNVKHAGYCISTNSLSSSQSPLACSIFSQAVTSARAMNKINVRERYHCWILFLLILLLLFSQCINQVNDNSGTCPHLSQPALPGQLLFFPSPPNGEAACCLNFPSNPSLPLPISTLVLERPALVTTWETRLKCKANCFTANRHMSWS